MKNKTVNLKQNATGADQAIIFVGKGRDLSGYTLLKSGNPIGSYVGTISKSLIK